MSYTAYVYAPLNSGINYVMILNFPGGVGGFVVNLGNYTPQGTSVPLWSMSGVTGTLGITPIMDSYPTTGPPEINYKWVVNVDGVVTEYTNRQSFDYVPTGTETNVWIRIEMLGTETHYVTLNFNANGGSGAPSSRTYTGTSSSVQVTLPSTVPTRSGYTFLGWSTSPTATSPSYYPGVTYNNWYGSTSSSYSQTLYAVWAEEDATGGVYIGNGTGFDHYVPHIWDGSWKKAVPHIWDGSWKKGL